MNNENFESNRQIDLSTIDISKIIILLDEYNNQFSLGSTMARQFTHVMDRNTKEELGSNDEEIDKQTNSTEEQLADQLMTYSQMSAESSELLDTVGLEYQPMKAGWVAAGSEGTLEGSTMRLNLKDGSKFTKYLESLNSNSITESQKDTLSKIIKILTKQFDSYDLDNFGDERPLEFISNLQSILIEYKRIFGENITKDIEKLEKYLSYARNGYLHEFKKAEQLALNRPFNNDGFVLRWHIDATPKFLQEHWDSVIKTLQIIFQNEKAHELYVQAKETAMVALESAIIDVTNLNDNDKSKKEFLTILQATKAKLLDF